FVCFGAAEGIYEDLPGFGVASSSDGDLAERRQAGEHRGRVAGRPQQFETSSNVSRRVFVPAESLEQTCALDEELAGVRAVLWFRAWPLQRRREQRQTFVVLGPVHAERRERRGQPSQLIERPLGTGPPPGGREVFEGPVERRQSGESCLALVVRDL